MKNNFINNLYRDPESADYAGYGSIDEMYSSMGVDPSTVIDATPSNYDPSFSVKSSPNWWDTLGQGIKAASPLLGIAKGNQQTLSGRTVVYSSNGQTTTSKATTTFVLVAILLIAIVVTVIVFMRKK
jgi:hypothetical protein